MDDFKPRRGKAAVAAAAQIVYDESGKIIDGLIKLHPQLGIPLGVIRANFGFMLAYRQEKLNQLTEFLMENQEVFTEDEFMKPGFVEAMNVFLDDYFRIRSEEKLKLAQNIFLDCAKSLEMPLYPLERYNDTLEKLSQTGIQFLGFIKIEIPKLRKEYVRQNMLEHGNTTDTTTLEEWEKIYADPKPLNFFIERHLDIQAKMRLENDKSELPLEAERKIKDMLRKPYTAAESELEQLGLGRGNTAGGGWGSSEYFYNLTDYGNKFISIVKPEEVFKLVKT